MGYSATRLRKRIATGRRGRKWPEGRSEAASMGSAITGHRQRDQFIRAIIIRDVLPLREVRVAVRLGLFFNCTTGQCNPGYDTLATELGISRRTLFRAIARPEHLIPLGLLFLGQL